MSKIKTKHNFQGKECFTRMNFLYQASVLMAGKNNTLSSYYGKLCKNIGKKAVLRIDPNVKRDFCKRCSLAQRPGITCDLNATHIRNRKSVEQLDQDVQIQVMCKLCGYQRNFNLNEDYKFWLENPESVVQCSILSKERVIQDELQKRYRGNAYDFFEYSK